MRKSKRPPQKTAPTQETCWHTGATCPDCGCWLATNGRKLWCGRPGCKFKMKDVPRD